MVDVLIGSDVCPMKRDLPHFQSGDAASIFNELLEEFEHADFSIVNLECPLTDQETPVSKSGPVLRADRSCINGFKQATISALGLANNHIMDHGPSGLSDTLEVCEQAGIATVGAGRNLDEARRVHVQEVGGVRLGVMAVAEHEFGIATADSWGANPLDPIEYMRTVKAERDKFDYLVVLVHGGNEGYPLPSPRLMNVCRFMIEEGADAVICQHTHVAGCYEAYMHGHIVYGQGNLVFDRYDDDAEYGHEGFLVRLSFGEGAPGMEIVPYWQSYGQAGTRRMSAQEDELFRQGLERRSEVLKDRVALEAEWARYCAGRGNRELSRVLGHNRLLTRLNRNGLLMRRLYSEQAILRLHNALRCEAHRDVLLTALDQAYQAEGR